MKRYLVVLTSEEEVTTHEVEWPEEIAVAVSALAQAVNGKATWSCSPRIHVTDLDSAANPGDAA